MLFSRNAVHTVLKGLSQNVAAQNYVLLRNFSTHTARRLRAKRMERNTNQQTTSGSVPHRHEDMDSATLLTLSAMGIHGARVEVLKRHIMVVDQCSRREAVERFDMIAAKNREGMALAALPYQIGIMAGVSAAMVSLPLVFDLPTALWFNHHFVTTEIPGDHDLETRLEVGSWAWNWMEPPLGTLSFALLALQFSRAQMHNLGIRPYTAALKKRRGKSLAAAFPQYEPKVVMDFSETHPLMNAGRSI